MPGMGAESFFLPTTLEEALKLKASFGKGAVLIAGGTDLVIKMRQGQASPDVIIQLPRDLSVSAVEESEGKVRLSALATLSELVQDPVLSNRLPLIPMALGKIGSPQIRNISTLGGNLVNACPACDSAPALMVYDATATLQTTDSTRNVPVDEFFLGPGATVVRPDEILVSVEAEVPPTGDLVRFRKYGPRGSNVIASANFAARIRIEHGEITLARLAAGSVAPVPVRMHRIEHLLVGRAAAEVSSSEFLAEVSALLEKEIAPISDVRGTQWYKRRVIELSLTHLMTEVAERG